MIWRQNFESYKSGGWDSGARGRFCHCWESPCHGRTSCWDEVFWTLTSNDKNNDDTSLQHPDHVFHDLQLVSCELGDLCLSLLSTDSTPATVGSSLRLYNWWEDVNWWKLDVAIIFMIMDWIDIILQVPTPQSVWTIQSQRWKSVICPRRPKHLSPLQLLSTIFLCNHHLRILESSRLTPSLIRAFHHFLF